jgi:Holliday junction resolvase RusA-like endonuclease
MKYRFFLKLPGLPKLNNTHYTNWRVAAAERKKWRRAAMLMASPQRPPSPLKFCSITCTRYAYGKKPDFDNLVISFKSVIDGLKDAGIIIDDSSDCILERRYNHEKAPAKKGWIEVIVEEI